ncbi:hypothetical protein [Bradyrhizobium genosp. SA-3]|uniref:hypothetical protein n=1 Tax=Bradyrhizobium genosp. SA-3 TaxID=508868 RepID=UPI0010290B1A|nr:hypothetical protein [Bradyrhizobium genosp. SA-3]
MRAISRDDFRNLFALYACADRHNKQHDRASRLRKQLTSTTTGDLLDQFSERIEAPGPEIIGRVLTPCARAMADNAANHDHASAFLHALLKELDQRQP